MPWSATGLSDSLLQVSLSGLQKSTRRIIVHFVGEAGSLSMTAISPPVPLETNTRLGIAPLVAVG